MTDERKKQLEERFWIKVLKLPGENACWVWVGSTDTRPNKGYGFFQMDKLMSAHRAAWIFAHGEIPDKLHVLHECDNSSCVRVGPGHLYLGTHQKNMEDRDERDRTARGDRHWARKDPEKAQRILQENNALMAREPERRARGERHGGAVLTATLARQLREKFLAGCVGGEPRRGLVSQLAREFSISRTSVRRVGYGKNWKELE